MAATNNGRIDHGAAAAAYDEPNAAWEQLAAAGFINGSFTGAASTIPDTDNQAAPLNAFNSPLIIGRTSDYQGATPSVRLHLIIGRGVPVDINQELGHQARRRLPDSGVRRGLRCTQELDLFLAHYPGRVVCITGTNGKSSTTRLLGRALQRGGVRCLVGGNIGHSLLDDEALWKGSPVAVLEVSSFQLERMDPAHRFAGALLSPITADHLDRHGSLERYHAAKERAATQATDFVIHGRGVEPASSFATGARRLLHTRDVDDSVEAFMDGEGYLCVRSDGEHMRLLHDRALRLLGDFQRDNALGAALAAIACGADPQGLALGLATTAPLDHRLQEIGRLGRLRIVDNGVSTSIDSTASALGALREDGPVHWVGGGVAKVPDDELPALTRELAKALAPGLASAHLFGRAAGPTARALATAGVPVTSHETLEDALSAARKRHIAQPQESPPGSIPSLLFSPAFASFDQFQNFRERAEAFRAWVGSAAAADRDTPRMAPPGSGG